VLDQWLKAIQAAGIKKIEGRIIGDDSLWAVRVRLTAGSGRTSGIIMVQAHQPLAGAENQFDIHLKASRSAENEVSVLKVVPEMPYLKIVNELKAGSEGTGDNVYAYFRLTAIPLTCVAPGHWEFLNQAFPQPCLILHLMLLSVYRTP
jgi:D-alanyl-D-alanine carboxypeptidase/D-alanyl-D-alanine-endopeptidase (penicillin-binding protein 4)